MTSDQEPKAYLSSFINIPWLRIGLALVLSAIAIVVLARNVNFDDVRVAYSESNQAYIALALLILILTLFIKAWRWQLMFVPKEKRPKYGPVYHAMLLGQFFNLILPIRIGDLARVYSLDSQTNVGKAKSLSTLVIEKALEIIGLILSVLLLIPFFVVPEFVLESGYPLAAVGITTLLILVYLAYRPDHTIKAVTNIARILPDRLEQRVTRVIVAGLEGLEALRNWRLSLWLGVLTFITVLLSVMVPLTLFLAFDLSFGVLEAVLLNAVVTLGMVPPSTPGKILVFEGLVIFMLRQFGIENGSLMLSYAIIFHLVVIVPQILLGGISFARGGYRIPSSNGPEASTSSQQS